MNESIESGRMVGTSGSSEAVRAPATVSKTGRISAIDWMRGLVMILMTIDHSGSIFDAHHMHGDAASGWIVGSPLPAGEFLTRWITHLCAPVFVFLAGTSLALSIEKRRDPPGQTAFLVKRGLFILALDPIWMSLGFAAWQVIVLQVLYAIGGSMIAMAFLRRLPTRALAAIGFAIAVFGELSAKITPSAQPWQAIWRLLFVGGRPIGRVVCAYPLIPWLSIMIFGWVFGRWLLTSERSARPRVLLTIGAALLACFAVVRGLDGYGNWALHRDSLAPLQWLHVAKYPPSLSFMTLELGIGFVLLALFFALDDGRPRAALAPLALFGSTAFFYYLLHAHLMGVVDKALHLDHEKYGLAKTYLGAAFALAVLAPLCARYRRYKAAHPDGWTRYV
jgi:uncharacterized membrane protein